MESNSLFLFYLQIILLPFGIIFGIHFRKYKYRYYILFTQCAFTLILLTIACFQDSEPHYLLGIRGFNRYNFII